ncbi:GntR family transcriptional regulator [Niallia sp. HCP3S3_B10]|uniref:GntR family transcriptional regulator n=1 Tax=Niallia sp. HCP3S3_B10 TaxID=3438944 RepID=UPI003F8BE8FF
MVSINRESNLPLYKQVKKLIYEDIRKHMEEGDVLPVESKLEKIYHVSRITIRKAIDELASEGIVEKVQGKGTFVRSRKIIQEASSITSWTEEMKQKGKKTETTQLNIFEVFPSKKLAKKLQLTSGEKIIGIERLRVVDGEPIAIMYNYLREKFIPGFLENGLTKESLYEELEENYNILLEEANEQIRARIAVDAEASKLQIPPDSAVLHITRTSFLPDGTPFEMVELVSRSDKYEYHIKVTGRNKNKVY